MQPQHQTLTRPSPAVTATGLADPTLVCLVTSVPAGSVDNNLHDLRLRSRAMMMMMFTQYLILSDKVSVLVVC